MSEASPIQRKNNHRHVHVKARIFANQGRAIAAPCKAIERRVP